MSAVYRDYSAEELVFFLEEGVIEEFMLSDEQRAAVAAYHEGFEDALESHIEAQRAKAARDMEY